MARWSKVSVACGHTHEDEGQRQILSKILRTSFYISFEKTLWRNKIFTSTTSRKSGKCLQLREVCHTIDPRSYHTPTKPDAILCAQNALVISFHKAWYLWQSFLVNDCWFSGCAGKKITISSSCWWRFVTATYRSCQFPGSVQRKC